MRTLTVLAYGPPRRLTAVVVDFARFNVLRRVEKTLDDLGAVWLEMSQREGTQIFVWHEAISEVRNLFEHWPLLVEWAEKRQKEIVLLAYDLAVPLEMRPYLNVHQVCWPDAGSIHSLVDRRHPDWWEGVGFEKRLKHFEERLYPLLAGFSPGAVYRLLNKAKDEDDLRRLAGSDEFLPCLLPKPAVTFAHVWLPQEKDNLVQQVPADWKKALQQGGNAPPVFHLADESGRMEETVDAAVHLLNRGGDLLLLEIDFSLVSSPDQWLPLLRQTAGPRPVVAAIKGVRDRAVSEYLAGCLTKIRPCRAIFFTKEER